MEDKTMKNNGLRASWCRFVLNEGIIPSMIARRIKNNDKDKQDTKLLASVLIKRENFNDALHPEIASMARASFHNDPELIAWLSKTDSLLSVIINFADLQNNDQIYMGDLLDGAYSSFIKSCPLVSEEIKNEYLHPDEQIRVMTRTRAKNSSYNRKDDHPKKQEFMAYLLDNGYSQNTCNSYKSSINTVSSFFNTNLWEIDDAAIMQKMFNEYAGNPEFIKRDYDVHKALSNGLRRYIMFLEERDR